jgi:hypothetical protein
MSNILEELQDKKKELYNEIGKNMIFKKQQKNDVAKQISEQYNVDDLLPLFCYKKDNNVVVDYNILKIFVYPDIYPKIIDYVMKKYENNECSSINIHFNLNSFSMTAAERYKDLIKMYFDKTMASHIDITSITNKIYVYYTPNILNQLLKMFHSFIPLEIRDKVQYFPKKESDEKWNTLQTIMKQ